MEHEDKEIDPTDILNECLDYDIDDFPSTDREFHELSDECLSSLFSSTEWINERDLNAEEDLNVPLPFDYIT